MPSVVGPRQTVAECAAPDGPDAAASCLDLYWIPLGAGACVVRVSGRLYERLTACVARRSPQALYHSALIATTATGRVVFEMAPVFDDRGHIDRRVVGQGTVGSRLLGRWRVFRYEIRRWRDGDIPDLGYAVASPVRITEDTAVIGTVLDLVALVPTPV